MTKEMQRLRDMLDERGIKWVDASSYIGCSLTRTRFWVGDKMCYVIHGYATYGGYNPITEVDEGLLELLCTQIDPEPFGWLTADDVIEKVFGGN